MAANAGLSTPSIIFKISLDITNSAPVFPDETIISFFPTLTESIAIHILVCFPSLIASLTEISPGTLSGE